MLYLQQCFQTILYTLDDNILERIAQNDPSFSILIEANNTVNSVSVEPQQRPLTADTGVQKKKIVLIVNTFYSLHVILNLF